MTNWKEKTDFEINIAVTAIVRNCEDWDFNGSEFYHCGIDGSGYFVQGIIDYCNNPAFAWSIIVENNINLRFRNGMFKSKDWCNPIARCGEIWHSDKNPLRAAMIVFLMIHKDKK